MKTKIALFASALTLLAALPSMQAAVIYQDNFTGNNTTNLGAPWVKNDTEFVKADGSFNVNTNAGFAYYLSGGSMGVGGKWLISANITQTTRTPGAWAGLGISSSATPNIWSTVNNSFLTGGLIIASLPGVWEYTNGVSGQTDNSTRTYGIEVDNTGLNTKLTWFLDSTQVATYTGGNGIITFQSAGLVGNTNAGPPAQVAGKFNSFTIEQTVIPEPSTWALLALSLTTVMVLRRRRAA